MDWDGGGRMTAEITMKGETKGSTDGDTKR